MPELNITLDAKALARLRRLVAVSRLTAAKALTYTAERAVPAWKGGQAVFHKRNSWIDRGVRMRAATPTDLTARVGSLDRFLARHIVGINEPKEGRLFVPIYRQIAEAFTHRQVRRALDRMDGTKRKTFILHNGGKTFLARRTGKERSPLTILGKFQDGAKVKARLDAEGIVDGVVKREFGTIYERLLLRALEKGKL